MSENEASTTAESEDQAEAAVAEKPEKMTLEVEITDIGPCKKHVRVIVPRADIDEIHKEAVGDLVNEAQVPGFRPGRVPRELAEKRFRKELSAQVREKVLMESLEQLSEEHELDAINEPNLNVEAIEIPEEGDFEYEFDVEVRPEFELPEYTGLTIDKPVRDVNDEDVEEYLEQFLSQYGDLETFDGPAEVGHYLEASLVFKRGGEVLARLSDDIIRLQPTIRFQDAELTECDELLGGVTAGESREVGLTISSEAADVDLRGETIDVEISVKEVKSLKMPELNKEFLQKVGADSEEELRDQVREMLERQVSYDQRQTARRQVLEKITESAHWELPESLVSRQVENALRREILEMQQAGFTTQEIRARENELRQNALTSTRQALKEHFVLDRIAVKEEIETEPMDVDMEITMMAVQQGENPRRLRARLEKSGMIENLRAQIRERKAIDFVLESAEFNEIPSEPDREQDVEAVDFAICKPSESAEESQDDDTQADED